MGRKKILKALCALKKYFCSEKKRCSEKKIRYDVRQAKWFFLKIWLRLNPQPPPPPQLNGYSLSRRDFSEATFDSGRFADLGRDTIERSLDQSTVPGKWLWRHSVFYVINDTQLKRYMSNSLTNGHLFNHQLILYCIVLYCIVLYYWIK